MNPTFVRIWFIMIFTLVPISAGFSLSRIIWNWNMTFIKNRQPYSYFIWILMIAIEALAVAALLLVIQEGWTVQSVILVAVISAYVYNYITYALFFHRIWMVFFMPLFQKSLLNFDILEAKAVRSRNTLSNVWVKQRHRLGNSLVMFVIWFFFCCVFSGLTIYYGYRCGYKCLTSDYDQPPSLVHDVAAGCLVIFGVSMLCVQKFFTASDTFGISTELAIKVTVIATFCTISGLILKTEETTSVDKIMWTGILATSSLLVELFVTDYYMWAMTSRTTRSKNTTIVHDTIDLDIILKNENLFKKFEKHLTQEHSIENLNFLVSCIQYRRTVLYQGAIESSNCSDSEPENFEQLHWRNSVKPQTLANRNSNIPKMARLIYNEFCQTGSPQWINLGKETARLLSRRIKNLSNICDYPELDIFSEAFDCIRDLLSNDSLRRFKMNLDNDSKYYSGGLNGDKTPLLVAGEY